MMGRALLMVGWLSTLGLVGAGAVGYGASGSSEWMRLHVLLALVSSLLLLFSHSWIMFFLIGTGKAIKRAVADAGGEPEVVEQTKVFKNQAYPSLMLAMGAAMVTFICGGGVLVGALPPWVHHALFYATLVSQARALLVEGRVLYANDRLIADLGRRPRAPSDLPERMTG